MTRIAFISPSGWGNLGDAAIQDSFVENTRERLADDVEITGITLNPTDTERRHRVPAFPMEATSPGLLRRNRSTESDAPPDPTSTPGSHHRVRRSKLLSPVRAAWQPVRRLGREAFHTVAAFFVARDADLLVISGGGQLDQFWGGVWAEPFALAKWALVARLAGTPLMTLSVGVGTVTSPLAKRFLRFVLARSAYVSVRDSRSADIVSGLMGGQPPPCVPDLAFGHPAGARSPRPPPDDRTVVALSPIAYLDPAVWPESDHRRFADYLDRMVDLTHHLTARGHHIRMFVSSPADLGPARYIHARAAAGVELVEPRTVDELFEVVDSSHVAVVSRLHCAILAHVRRVPTIALSYDWKVDLEAADIGLAAWSRPIDRFDPAEVADMVDRAIANRTDLVATIDDTFERMAGRVRRQYDEVLSTAMTTIRPSTPAPAAVAGRG